MAFIRIKKVKDWKYAYLVENSWKSKKTKQKVKEYLGRVHVLENIVGAEFNKNINGMKFEEAAAELVRFELMKNGFSDDKGVLKKDNFIANFDKAAFVCGKKPVVFESNEGFICSHTFKSLLGFKPFATEEETAMELAEAILGAGISVPHNVFVNLFEKVQKPSMPLVEDSQKFIKNV